MKIEIETNDFLGDEDTIRNEVIDQIANMFMTKIGDEAENFIQQSIKESLSIVIEKQLTEIVKMHLDTEFIEKNQYGKTSGSTTVRNKIADILQKECVFKDTTYSSDQTIFTKIVKHTIEGEMQKFKKGYTSMVNTKLMQECLDMATKTLKKACGIK